MACPRNSDASPRKPGLQPFPVIVWTGNGIIPPPPCPRTRNERIERHRKHGTFLRLRESRARRARRKVRQVRHQQGPPAPAPETEHRAREGLLRLAKLQ